MTSHARWHVETTPAPIGMIRYLEHDSQGLCSLGARRFFIVTFLVVYNDSACCLKQSWKEKTNAA